MAYKALIASQGHKTHLGLPNLLVLTVTTSERHLKGIMEASGENALFLFKTVGRLAMPDTTLLTMPWLRAGHPPLTIANS